MTIAHTTVEERGRIPTGGFGDPSTAHESETATRTFVCQKLAKRPPTTQIASNQQPSVATQFLGAPRTQPFLCMVGRVA